MKKIFLISVFAFVLISLSLISVSAYYGGYGGYYGNNYRYNGGNYASETYSTATSYNRPFGHSYYYQPFGFTSYNSYGYTRPSGYQSSLSYRSTSGKDYYYGGPRYDLELRYDSPYSTGYSYNSKKYDSNGFLIETSSERYLSSTTYRRNYRN